MTQNKENGVGIAIVAPSSSGADTSKPVIAAIAASLKYVEKEEDIHVNVAQDIIVTTEDKVHRCLTAHLGTMENRKAWLTPACTLLTIVATLVTCTFQDFVLKAAEWKALFVFIGIASAGWLGKSLISLCRSHTMDDVIDELKKNALHRH